MGWAIADGLCTWIMYMGDCAGTRKKKQKRMLQCDQLRQCLQHLVWSLWTNATNYLIICNIIWNNFLIFFFECRSPCKKERKGARAFILHRLFVWLRDSDAHLLEWPHATVDPQGVGCNARDSIAGTLAQLLQRNIRYRVRVRVGVANASGMGTTTNGRAARFRLWTLPYYPWSIRWRWCD